MVAVTLHFQTDYIWSLLCLALHPAHWHEIHPCCQCIGITLMFPSECYCTVWLYYQVHGYEKWYTASGHVCVLPNHLSTSLCGHTTSSLGGEYLEVELRAPAVSTCSPLWDVADAAPQRGCAPLHSPPQSTKQPVGSPAQSLTSAFCWAYSGISWW